MSLVPVPGTGAVSVTGNASKKRLAVQDPNSMSLDDLKEEKEAAEMALEAARAEAERLRKDGRSAIMKAHQIGVVTGLQTAHAENADAREHASLLPHAMNSAADAEAKLMDTQVLAGDLAEELDNTRGALVSTLQTNAVLHDAVLQGQEAVIGMHGAYNAAAAEAGQIIAAQQAEKEALLATADAVVAQKDTQLANMKAAADAAVDAERAKAEQAAAVARAAAAKVEDEKNRADAILGAARKMEAVATKEIMAREEEIAKRDAVLNDAFVAGNALVGQTEYQKSELQRANEYAANAEEKIKSQELALEAERQKTRQAEIARDKAQRDAVHKQAKREANHKIIMENLAAKFEAMGESGKAMLARIREQNAAGQKLLRDIAELEAKLAKCESDKAEMQKTIDSSAGEYNTLLAALPDVPTADPAATSAPAPAPAPAPVSVPAPTPAGPVFVPTGPPVFVPSTPMAPAATLAEAEERVVKAQAHADKWKRHYEEKAKAQRIADAWWASHPGAERRDKAVKAKTVVKYAKDYIPGKNDFLGVDTAPSSGKGRVKFY